MIQRQHVVPEFFDGAEDMRRVLDARFKDPYTDSIPWYYFCDPGKYAYLRTMPQQVFPAALFDRFIVRLKSWCLEKLGLVPMNLPYLHLMMNGCRLELHSDFHNGTFGYVYSLTRWSQRNFVGGETLLLRDGVPSYKKHHVHGEVLYELIPAEFNQLLVFDDRIVHATPTIEGNMDPIDGRIAMVGHIRASSPEVLSGSLLPAQLRNAVQDALAQLRDRLRGYKDVQGMISFRIDVRAMGAVEALTPLTDNIITASMGYEASEAVTCVKAIILQTLASLRFPSTDGPSVAIVPVLIPIPDLRPIAISIPHQLPRDALTQRISRVSERSVGPSMVGTWEGDSFVVREPIAGSIRIEANELLASFDPPMWVPSQRESFQRAVLEWARSATAKSDALV